MSEEPIADDSSHYEISLTAGQAFVAFVLLLFSLAASFAFGIIIGKGDASDRLVVRREPAVVTEAKASVADGKIVELGVPEETTASSSEVAADAATAEPKLTEAPAGAADGAAAAGEDSPERASETPAAAEAPEPRSATPAPAAPAAVTPARQDAPADGPVYAQVLSSSDQKAAEAMAAKLIDAGFTSAYVEKGATDKGQIYRVRVRFRSEAEGRASAERLRGITRTEPWITRNPNP